MNSDDIQWDGTMIKSMPEGTMIEVAIVDGILRDRVVLNHMPDDYQIDSDGAIHDVVKSSAIVEGYLKALASDKDRLTTPSTHYLIKKDGTIEQLVDPESVKWGPIVHKEPDCRGYNRCRHMEPHKHGFACDKTCNECWGQCHSDCPANEEHHGKHAKD